MFNNGNYALYMIKINDIQGGQWQMEKTGESFQYDLRKADLVNLIVIMALLAIVIEQAVMRAESVLSDVISALFVALLVFINFRWTPRRFLKSLLFGVIPALAVCANIVMNPFGVDRHYMLLMTVVVVALYFNSRLVLVYGGILNALCIAVYIIAPVNFIGESDRVNPL